MLLKTKVYKINIIGGNYMFTRKCFPSPLAYRLLFAGLAPRNTDKYDRKPSKENITFKNFETHYYEN